MKKVLTPEMEKYFVENAYKESIKSMSEKFSVSDRVVKRVFKLHGIKIPKELVVKFRTEKLKGRSKLTPEQEEIIIRDYLKKPIKKIAKEINTDYGCIMRKLENLGLSIPEEIRQQRKAVGMFRKGQEPVNKGKKWTEYMSKEAQEISRKTTFKKGTVPPNKFSDYQEVIRLDKRKNRPYFMIRLPGESKLIYKHIWIWEQANNTKLPEGHNIVFKDGNSMNCTIENLECISNAELLKRNTIHKYPEELQKVIKLKNKITRKIRTL